MEKCKKCNSTLSSKIIFKSFWKGYRNFSCTNCQTQYEFTSKDRLIGGFVIGISTLITSVFMNYVALEIILNLTLGLFLMVFLCSVLSLVSLLFFTYQSNEL